MGKILLSLTTATMLSLSTIASANNDSDIKVEVNHQPLQFNQPPVIVNETTLVPLRGIFEALGVKVVWDQSSQTVTALKDDNTIKLTIGQLTASRNNDQVQLSVPGTIINGSTMVPARFIAESFGETVDWNGNTRTISIYDSILSKSPISQKGWKLIWSDEFNGEELDLNKWNIENKGWPYNSELEYYTPEDVKVSQGNLHIISEKRNYNGREYTSGRIDTKGKFSFTYGKVDIRAKLPEGKGIWPAFWLLPTEGYKWEIDQMEMLGDNPYTYYMTNHYLKNSADPKSGFIHSQVVYDGKVDLSQDFHTYSAIWEPGKITYLLDNKIIGTSLKGVPSEPAYIILNTAVGGKWPGNPESSTEFPTTMDIEYVKVYQ